MEVFLQTILVSFLVEDACFLMSIVVVREKRESSNSLLDYTQNAFGMSFLNLAKKIGIFQFERIFDLNNVLASI